MTRVEIHEGKVKVTKTAKNNQKPKKFPYPDSLYDQLLKLAKQCGIDTGDTKAKNTAAVNALTKAVLEDFLISQAKPKAQQA